VENVGPGTSDEALKGALAKARGADDLWGAVREDVLREIVRRGGKAWETVLAEEVRLALEEGKDKDDPAPELNLLAALRRVQGGPDPLEVVVEGLEGAACTWPLLPRCRVTLRNVDADKLPFLFTDGGDYRTGRYGRFRFDARDESGRTVQVLQRWGIMGGMFSRGPMESAETWDTELNMSDYILLPRPGKYTVRIQYHNHYEISSSDDTAGSIVFSSREFHLVSKPRLIELTRAERDGLQAQVAALEEEKDLVIVNPGGDGTGVFEPGSPPALLLAGGWKSIPVLVPAVSDGATSPRKRAWLLGLLFTLTGLHNPTDAHGTVDEFRFQAGASLGSRKNGELSGGMTSGGGWRERGTKISPEAQMEIAREWTEFQKCLEVRILD